MSLKTSGIETMTAKQLIHEMQLHNVKHPEAANWPIQFLGCRSEDNNGYEYTPEVKTVARVVLDVRTKERRFLLDGE